MAVIQCPQHLNRLNQQSNDVQTIEKLMMDCIMQQLHMLKKLEFDGNQSDSLRSLCYTNKVHGNGGIRKLSHMQAVKVC